jgi:DNA repair protein RadD
VSTLAPLRPHQAKALDGLKASLLAGKKRPMLALPTGAGKTVIAAHIVHGALTKRKRITFCVPALSLVDQTFERFRENGIDPGEMGIIQASHPWRRPHAPVQIATAQTLTRRERPESDVVVIDEAHIRFKVYETWMQDPAWQAKPFIGLSATPWARGLGRLFDDLVKPTSIGELIDQDYLSPFKVFAPSHPDLSGVKTVAGDYHEGQLAEVMSEATLVADDVSTWLA